MSLDQAIKHGKEHRKPHRGPKAADGWCNRLHKRMVELTKAEDESKEANETKSAD